MAEGFREVCRIDVGTRRGSGFLIAPNSVLTAAHVVANLDDDSVKFAGQFNVTFARLSSSDPPTTYKGTVGAFDPDRDWAVVTLDRVPMGGDGEPLTPLQVRPLEAIFPTHWTTYGFSRDAFDAGQAYGGEMRTFSGDRLQLSVTEASAEGGIKVSGLSGSPVIVNGAVVGIIASTPETDKGLPKGGTLYAVPLTTVVRGGSPPFDLPLEDPLFFSPPVADWIGLPIPASLPEAARALGVPWNANISLEMAREVARVMMRSGLGPTRAALMKLTAAVPEGKAKEILRLSATSWIDVKALEPLWPILADPAREQVVVLLNAKSHHVGDWYHLRSSCLTPRVYPPPAVLLPITRPDDLQSELTAALVNLHQCSPEDVAAENREWDHASEPIVAVVEGLPPAEAVTAAHKVFPRTKLLLCAGPSMAAARERFPAAEPVLPAIPPDTAEAVVSEYESSLKEFARLYKRLPKG